jgi:hypothetical protein
MQRDMPQTDEGPEDGDSEAGVPPGPDGYQSHAADGSGAEPKRRRMGDEASAAPGGGGLGLGRTPLVGPGGRTPLHAERTPVYTDATPLYTDAYVPNEGRGRP